MHHFIGIDVGGTTSTVAIGNQDRQVVYISNQFPSCNAQGPQTTIPAIVHQVTVGLKEIGVAAARVSRVGLSAPGPATFDGVLLNSPNFDPGLWNDFPFRASLEHEIARSSPSVLVDYIGDGQAAALGEYSIRSRTLTWRSFTVDDARAEDLSSLFMAIVGTGLGGGEVKRGRAVRGSEGRAGHAGHIFLPHYAFRYEHDQQLRVGNATCTLESAVSLTALTHQLAYRLSLPQWRTHPLRSLTSSNRDKAKQLRPLAAEGDALAIELFCDQARALGIGLLAVNYLGDYDLLVIGGGVCDLAADVRERYRTTAEQAYREFALDGFRNLDRFEFSVCGDEAPVIGALAFAYSQAEH